MARARSAPAFQCAAPIAKSRLAFYPALTREWHRLLALLSNSYGQEKKQVARAG